MSIGWWKAAALSLVLGAFVLSGCGGPSALPKAASEADLDIAATEKMDLPD